MATQKMLIDMSGRGGLSDNFSGSLTLQTAIDTSNINLRYLAEDNQMVSGVFNPISFDGYMSPCPNALVTITPAVSFTQIMAATQVDDINSDVYFFENGTKIQRATGLDDLTLTDDRTISGATGVDLAIYTINDNRTLFYAYETSSVSTIGIKDITATASPTFTADSTTDFITISGGSWELWEDRAVMFTTTTTLPAPLSTSTIYYLKGVSGATAQVSLTAGGAAVDITDTGTGTHSISLFLDTFSNTVPASATSFTKSKIKMIPSGDGFMYILTKNKVHRFDGTSIGGANGTLYPNILTAPEYFYFSHGIDYRNNLYIVVQKNTFHQVTTSNVAYVNSEVGVYIWNRQSTFFNTSDFIPIPGMKEIRSIFISPNGKIRIIGISSSRKVQIRELNGGSFTLVKELPVLSFPQYEDSLCVVDGFTVWQGNDGKLWYYGSEKPGEKEILFSPMQLSTDASLVTGAISFGLQQDFGTSGRHGFYVSFSETGTETLKKAYPFSTSTVNSIAMVKHIGDVFTPVKFLPRLSNVKHIDIYMKQATFTSSLTTVEATLKIYFNQSSTAWASKSITRGDINKGYISIEVNKPFINSIQIETEHTITTSVGTADFAPAYAIIEYETTGTIK